MIQINGRSHEGNLKDNIIVPFSLGGNRILAHLNAAYYHVHGVPFAYPDHADNIILTAGSGVWSQAGAIIEVIPAVVLPLADFDLHWLNVSDISANSQIQIDIFNGASGAEVFISSAKLHRNAVQSQEGSKRIQVPQQLAGERISCRLCDSTSGQITCGVSFEGHFYV